LIRPSLQDFIEPNWHAPIAIAEVLAAIPESATITGMFLEPTARDARQQGKPLPSARERYVPFRFYPLREHVQLLVEASAAYFPQLPLRKALRKLGRAGPNAFLASTLGRVSVASAHGTFDFISRLAKTYPINLPGTRSEVREVDAHNAIVSLRDLLFFADCHHVGVFEGVLRYAGVQGEVKINAHSEYDVDLLCSWR
jgi:uncharacterized protein (TIGR02265 family)